jgi:hypothetical protein
MKLGLQSVTVGTKAPDEEGCLVFADKPTGRRVGAFVGRAGLGGSALWLNESIAVQALLEICQQRDSVRSPRRPGNRPLSERHGVNDLAAFIGDCDRPEGVMAHLIEQSTPEFRCSRVRRSLGCQRGRADQHLHRPT